MHARGFCSGWAPTSRTASRWRAARGSSVDAASYAAWDIDYLKTVHCPGLGPVTGAVSDLAAALARTERRIVLSLAHAPFQEWMRDTVNLWRTAGDAQPTWNSLVSSIDSAVPLAAYARPGAFNDPDMLEIGNGALTAGEKRVQFSVWSILSAPLLAGNDLSLMTEETRAILTNSDVIALNQDPLGLQAALDPPRWRGRDSGQAAGGVRGTRRRPLESERNQRRRLAWPGETFGSTRARNRARPLERLDLGCRAGWFQRHGARPRCRRVARPGTDRRFQAVEFISATSLDVRDERPWPVEHDRPMAKTERSMVHRYGSAAGPTRRASGCMAPR